MTKFFKRTSLVILGLTVLLTLSTTSIAQADTATDNAVCQGIGAAGGTSGCESKTQSTNNIDHTITYVVDILSIIGGIIAVFMIVLAGLRFVLSGGESSNIATSKNIIIYAVVGIVVIAISQIIVHFVLKHVV
jgi:beta-lactamase regulating signal transducer with metallopeptidase domain